jgi:hypothetical protein
VVRVLAAVDAAETSEVGVVEEGAIATLAPAKHRRVGFVRHSKTRIRLWTQGSSRPDADLIREAGPKVSTTYGQDISNELNNKTTLILPEPVHTGAVLTRHATRERMNRKRQANLQQARMAQKVILEAAVTHGNDPEAPLKLAVLENAIAEGDVEQKSARLN